MERGQPRLEFYERTLIGILRAPRLADPREELLHQRRRFGVGGTECGQKSIEVCGPLRHDPRVTYGCGPTRTVCEMVPCSPASSVTVSVTTYVPAVS